MFGVEALAAACDGRVAVYGRTLDRKQDENIVVGDVDRRFPTGSAGKILVLLAFAEAVASGAIDPTARLDLVAPYREARMGSGVLRHLDAGLRPTLSDCAVLMMIVSDNVATDLLLDALGGPTAVNHALARLGCGDVEITSPTVWVLPPGQFAMASPRGLANTWALLAEPGPIAERCRAITWRNQHRDGFGRLVPFSPDLADFGLPTPLRLWSKAGSYPSVSCEAGLFATDSSQWVLAVMAEELADWGNSSACAGPTLRAEVSRAVYEAWR